MIQAIRKGLPEAETAGISSGAERGPSAKEEAEILQAAAKYLQPRIGGPVLKKQ